jgi:hypothetical protein
VKEKKPLTMLALLLLLLLVGVVVGRVCEGGRK